VNIPLAFLAVLVGAALLSFLLTPVAGRLGRHWQLLDLPGDRRRHPKPTPRTGGIALFAGFFAVAGIVFLIEFVLQDPAVPQDARRLRGVLLGTAFVFIVGLVDDRVELKPGPQYVAQFIAALVAISHTVFIQEVTNPLVGEPQRLPDILTFSFTVFWVMGMMNTVNWLDGLDGLAAGVAAIAALLFAVHAYNLARVHEPMRINVALFPTALAGACLGFLPFNFFPARVFMGSAGAMTLGYSLATLSILAPARIATALLVMAIPIIDVAWLIFNRWQRGAGAAQAGRDHLHFRLLDRGMPQRQIVLLYYGFCAFLGSLALLMPSGLYKLLALVVMGVMTISVLVWLSRTASHR
jgi:UDP-GlcNAc:undecaprenyl-phosphate/decaprenyl-phosphate GlcNAc-1-phosphate transferase